MTIQKTIPEFLQDLYDKISTVEIKTIDMDYVISDDDNGKLLSVNDVCRVITIPEEENIPIGTKIEIENSSSRTVALETERRVTLQFPSKYQPTILQFGRVTLLKKANNTWIASGNFEDTSLIWG